jgi:hypothetical protein
MVLVALLAVLAVAVAADMSILIRRLLITPQVVAAQVAMEVSILAEPHLRVELLPVAAAAALARLATPTAMEPEATDCLLVLMEPLLFVQAAAQAALAATAV